MWKKDRYERARCSYSEMKHLLDVVLPRKSIVFFFSPYRNSNFIIQSEFKALISLIATRGDLLRPNLRSYPCVWKHMKSRCADIYSRRWRMRFGARSDKHETAAYRCSDTRHETPLTVPGFEITFKKWSANAARWVGGIRKVARCKNWRDFNVLRV